MSCLLSPAYMITGDGAHPITVPTSRGVSSVRVSAYQYCASTYEFYADGGVVVRGIEANQRRQCLELLGLGRSNDLVKASAVLVWPASDKKGNQATSARNNRLCGIYH